jgi:hypothetical protein
MSSSYRIERDSGINRQQLAELREKWPLAFPVNDQDVRPLALDATHEIAAVMGWSYGRWKWRRCTARRQTNCATSAQALLSVA